AIVVGQGAGSSGVGADEVSLDVVPRAAGVGPDDAGAVSRDQVSRVGRQAAHDVVGLAGPLVLHVDPVAVAQGGLAGGIRPEEATLHLVAAARVQERDRGASGA